MPDLSRIAIDLTVRADGLAVAVGLLRIDAAQAAPLVGAALAVLTESCPAGGLRCAHSCRSASCPRARPAHPMAPAQAPRPEP